MKIYTRIQWSVWNAQELLYVLWLLAKYVM